jgi:hypothetical protein
MATIRKQQIIYDMRDAMTRFLTAAADLQRLGTEINGTNMGARWTAEDFAPHDFSQTDLTDVITTGGPIIGSIMQAANLNKFNRIRN